MRRLLVVGDQEENLHLLQVFLEGQGYRVEQARNGAEALDKARREPPDVALADVLMPDMDGFALCRNWRADERLSHIPFVLRSATHTDPRDEQLALDSGADAFVTKPAEPEALMAVILDVLGRAETARPASSPGQRHAEQASQRSNDLLTNLARLVPGVIYQYRLYPDGRSAFPYASPGMNDIYEVTPEEVREDATPVFGRLHPEDYDYVAECIQESARTLQTFYCQFRVILPRQGLRWRWSQAQPERTADGGTLWHGIISDITEHKRAEEELRESEERYRQLLESAHDWIWEIDTRGVYTSSSPKVFELLGYTPQEVLGKTPVDFTPRGEDARLATVFRSIVAERKPFRDVAKLNQHKDGHLVFLESSGMPIFDAQGEFRGYRGMDRDVSERMRAEEALRESEEAMRYIVKYDPNAIAVYDTGLHYIAVSDRYLQDYGITESDIIGRHHYDVFPEIPQKWRDVHQRCLGGAIERDEDDYFERLDGSITYNSWECRPWYRAGGEIAGIITYTEVTTERKQAETRLKRSEARYRGLYESMRDGFASTDLQGRLLEFNEAYRAMLGFDREELLARTYIGLTPEKWRALEADIIQNQVLARGYSDVYEKEYQRADGSIFPVELRVLLERDESGAPTAMWGVVRDISERVEAERAIHERDEQLRQSQKMEAVGQLAGGIAHDFNNLLAVILGYSDLLLAGGQVPDSAREDLGQIRRAADRAGALTRQILAFSRRQALRPKVVSLNEVLDGMEPLLRRTLGEHIDLVTRQDPDLALVEADVHQFEQVIMNLAINARDAMTSGGGLTLETANVELDEEYCRTHPEATPGGYVMLAVSDTGTGMTQATLERVFEPFFTTKEPGVGTGLGLATVYGIVKQSHGTISVDSKPGEGASFKIYLPRATGQVGEESSEAGGTGPARGEETVLVVEDEAPLRDLVVRVLGSLGYRVLVAGTAAEARDVLQEIEYRLDLLLTDVVLPGGEQGNDLAHDLHALQPDLPVLYVSGYPRDAIVHAGQLDAGVNFLEKPFTPETLARTVRSVLDQTRG